MRSCGSVRSAKGKFFEKAQAAPTVPYEPWNGDIFYQSYPEKKNWQPNFRRGKVYFHILGLFLAFWDLKWSSNATLFFKWYRRQMINSIAYFRKLVLHDFAYVN